MHFDLDARRARLGVGSLADFSVGPRDAGEGPAGLWRAQLGTQWHQRLRAEAAAEYPGSEFEVAVEAAVLQRQWTITLSGRIDQLLRFGDTLTLREIKTVSRPLPEDEAALRADYPEYFAQLAAYAALLAPREGSPRPRAELMFVELDSGLAQTVALAPADERAFRVQLDRVAEFLDLRLHARDRRRHLRFRPPFAALRPGQETVQRELEAALQERPCALLLEAPTGFGKTGVLLEFALGRLRSGHFDRLIYLTGKSTGQLQVVRTLAAMQAPPPGGVAPAKEGATGSLTPVAAWHVRNKGEHCINSVFHCVRETCAFIDGAAARWPESGLARFYLFDDQPHDLEDLRAAGRAATICPYEITRTALAFQDVWIGDYNYVFAPANRGLFYHQPGFQPERTLVVIDEAHNLPGRVAGAYSHAFAADDAGAVREALDLIGAPSAFLSAWEEWALFLAGLAVGPALSPADEEEARRILKRLAGLIATQPLDFAALGPGIAARLWQITVFDEQTQGVALPLLWWSPRAGELALTCLDAAPAIGAALGEFGGAVLATATPGPTETFAEACGLPLWRVAAETPWRRDAYDVACDVRVDTTFQQRARNYPVTAATVAALCLPGAPLAVFFSSYAYAEAIAAELAGAEPALRVAVQPRRAELSAQAAWVEQSLTGADALFLVLGSSFAESIDLLGGRVGRAMVVGPALPEVNPVQRARMANLAALGREAAFQRVYALPGMQKVNQALGRLVRAPGQRARVLLHCRRFVEPPYAELLAADYQGGLRIESEANLAEWLGHPQRHD